MAATRGRIREAEAALASVGEDRWLGLRAIAEAALDLARTRLTRTDAAARARARQTLQRLEPLASADAELRVACRWIASQL